MNKRIKILSFILALVGVLVFVGSLLFFQKSKKLPVVTPVNSSPKTLELASELSKNNFSLESVPIENKNSIIASVSGLKVIFSRQKSLKTQVKALQLTLPGLKMESVIPREIDLRFDKVVLRY